MNECPHCGFRLPAVVDAFCPECREPLDERPTTPLAPPISGLLEVRPRTVKKAGGSMFVFLLSAWGLLCLLVALFALFAGDLVGAGVRALIGVSFLLAAGWRSQRALPEVSKDESRPTAEQPLHDASSSDHLRTGP